MEHLIWCDISFMNRDSIETWESDIRKQYVDENKELNENDLFSVMAEDNSMYLEDERASFATITLPEKIICIADLGLWNRRVSGYKEIDSLSDCLCAMTRGCSDLKWYVDKKGNFRGIESHHDGTNKYLYRMWKNGLSEVRRQNFLNKVYSGNVTSNDISRCTVRLGDIIGHLYGWEIK